VVAAGEMDLTENLIPVEVVAEVVYTMLMEIIAVAPVVPELWL
jgi:hypothetical protein